MKTHIQELFFLRENENTLTKKVEINEDWKKSLSISNSELKGGGNEGYTAITAALKSYFPENALLIKHDIGPHDTQAKFQCLINL